MDNTEVITVLSLCSGYGGLELGLSRALANPVRIVAVEIEAFALANLVAKAEEGKVAVEALWPDLRTFPKERFRGCFDFIAAGYPCQPFSVAGKRKGTDDPRHLWPDIERIVKAVRPVWCFFENVPGHLTIGFPEVYRGLRDMGYKVEAGLFTAAECGAPHRRQRLFILANDTKSRGRRLSIRRRRQEQASIDINGTSKISPACEAVGNAEKQNKYKRGKCGIRAGQKAKEERQADFDNTDRPSSGQLADTAQQSSNRSGDTGQRRGNEYTNGRWPSRPGQPQYEWEEPRVVADTKSRQQRRGAGDRIGRRKRKQKEITENNGRRYNSQAQSRLGRAVNGRSGRVDRLRLLGNGVVPQQAEIAFRELRALFEI